MRGRRYTYQEWCDSGPWLASSVGDQLWTLEPERSEWCWQDAARGTANECRYGGQSMFYSVAEHSVKMSRVLRKRGESVAVQLAALLHDAPEGLGLKDIPRPWKRVPEMRWYCMLDERTTAVLLAAAGLPPLLPDVVHRIDREILPMELRNVFPEAAARIVDLPPDLPELDGTSWGWYPDRAEREFLNLLDVLGCPP